MEAEDPGSGSLRVLSYGQITVANAVGEKRVLRAKAFGGYLKAEESNVRAAEQEEIVSILKACTNSRDQLLILLIAETGFRIGEILGVSYTRDIDYGNHTILVWFRDDNENDARAKNAEYRRSRISDDTFEFLLHYLAEYRKLLQRQDYLFINISGEIAGQPLKVGSVYDMLGRMEKKTQIRITPHMLRRYFSVIRWNDGWPLEMISQALGHRHLDTTVKYLSVLDDRLMEASRAFYEKHSDDYGIWHIEELDYDWRNVFAEDFRRTVKTRYHSFYLKCFDHIKQYDMRKQVRLQVSRKNQRYPYEDRLLFLPYHPAQELVERMDPCQERPEWVWDFGGKAPEKMKRQIFDILNHLLKEDQDGKTLREHLRGLWRFYQFCVKMQVEDIEQMALEQSLDYRKQAVEEGKPKAAGIIDTCRRILFQQARENF